MNKQFKLAGFLLGCIPTLLQAGSALFEVGLASTETAYPSNVGWYDPPITRLMSIANLTGVAMPISFFLPQGFHIDSGHSTCPAILNSGARCQVAVVFNPDKLGNYSGNLKVCGHNGLWCSSDPAGFNITVTENDIVSTQCNAIQSRPFASLDCEGSYQYAENFHSFLAGVLHTTTKPTTQYFHYFQHKPSTNETTTPCLEARQSGENLDPLILGGGQSLCTLMGYATSSNGQTSAVSKLFPPYLTFLLGTSYPIQAGSSVLDNLSQLMTDFGQVSMDPMVQALGYNGYVDFLNNYYLQQMETPYADCGSSAVCPSLYYLPYATTASSLMSWPPTGINYWGISGGGGSGAGYQIQVFKPGSSVHYTLFSGGGGGGGGNTTPEDLNTSHITLLNTGSGGGGGSQFSSCYVTNDGNLNGLGLGAGIGSGYSAVEGHNITYEAPPATDYSYYPPITHPSWNHNTTLNTYVSNLDYLFNTLIPELYNEGYTIAITGGGGGGAGLEFLNVNGQEYQPHPVSIGYGFNFCFAFNKAQQHTASDCISSSSTDFSGSETLDGLIYKNIGTFFNQGMTLAVSACNGGYSNYRCTCTFQHAYVICELTNLLVVNGFTSNDIPSWLINPHCNDSSGISQQASVIDQLPYAPENSCATSIANFIQAQTSTACVPPWPH